MTALGEQKREVFNVNIFFRFFSHENDRFALEINL